MFKREKKREKIFQPQYALGSTKCCIFQTLNFKKEKKFEIEFDRREDERREKCIYRCSREMSSLTTTTTTTTSFGGERRRPKRRERRRKREEDFDDDDGGGGGGVDFLEENDDVRDEKMMMMMRTRRRRNWGSEEEDQLVVEEGVPPYAYDGEIVVAETKGEIDRAIDRAYAESKTTNTTTLGVMKTFGFDMEWKVTYQKGKGEAKTSVIQLAYERNVEKRDTTLPRGERRRDVRTTPREDDDEDVLNDETTTKKKTHCVVVIIRLAKRLGRANPLPTKLVRFLEDPTVRKAGVNARGDARKLMRDFNVLVNGVVELDALAKAKLASEQRWSLARLATRVLKKRVPKDARVRTSNWERNGELDETQLKYAAIDAMVGLDVWVALNEMEGEGYDVDPVPEGFVFRGRILEGEYDPDDEGDDDDDDDEEECDDDGDDVEPYAALREAAMTTLESEPTTSEQEQKTKEKLELTRGAKRKTPIPEDVEEILIQHLGGKSVDDIAALLNLTTSDVSKKLTIAFKAGHAYYWDLLGVSNDVWLTFLQSREENALATIRERLPNGAADMPKILFCACRFAREVLGDGKKLEGDESGESSSSDEDENDDTSEEEEEEEEEEQKDEGLNVFGNVGIA